MFRMTMTIESRYFRDVFQAWTITSCARDEIEFLRALEPTLLSCDTLCLRMCHDNFPEFFRVDSLVSSRQMFRSLCQNPIGPRAHCSRRDHNGITEMRKQFRTSLTSKASFPYHFQ